MPMNVDKPSVKRPAAFSLSSGGSTPSKRVALQPVQTETEQTFDNPDMQKLYALLGSKIDATNSITAAITTRVSELEVEGAVAKGRMNEHDHTLTSINYQAANQADMTDSLYNSNNLNQVLLSGVRVEMVNEVQLTASESIAKLVTQTKVHPGAVTRVFTQKFPAPKPGFLPDIVVYFVNGESGHSFRLEASRLRKEESPAWQSIYINNVVTKSTRVRICILQAIATAAQALPVNAGKTFYVSRYDVRPQLCIKGVNGNIKRTFYVDAVGEYESLLTPGAIDKARKIAGRTYGNRLKPTFIVL
jgi:hypothetical protein